MMTETRTGPRRDGEQGCWVDGDGTRLLGLGEVAARRGVKRRTINGYLSESRRNRDAGKGTPLDLPEPAYTVRDRQVKGDGRPLVVWTPLWRPADIEAWMQASADWAEGRLRR